MRFMTKDNQSIKDQLGFRAGAIHNKAGEFLDNFSGRIVGIGCERHPQLNGLRASWKGSLQTGN